jgi:hypothetical protein
MIQDSSNGTDVLKTEIRSSVNRLKAVKSGIPLSNVAPHNDENYYVPDLEDYYKGQDRIQRKLGIITVAEEEKQIKFFITEQISK